MTDVGVTQKLFHYCLTAIVRFRASGCGSDSLQGAVAPTAYPSGAISGAPHSTPPHTNGNGLAAGVGTLPRNPEP